MTQPGFVLTLHHSRLSAFFPATLQFIVMFVMLRTPSKGLITFFLVLRK